MAKQVDEQNQYYSRLLIYTRRRLTLFILLSITIPVVAFFIFQFKMGRISAHDLAFVVGVCLLGFSLFPKTEEWQYTPWQSKAITYEKHYAGKKHD